MDIEELLDSLLHKVYGKEVRQGFVDSIRQCYKDATGNPESVAAVVEDNKKMRELIDQAAVATIEEGEIEDLPINTINDDEIGEKSTWSSEKILDSTVQNVIDYQDVFDNATTVKKMAFDIGNKIGVELYYINPSHYNGSIAANDKLGFPFTTEKSYKHPPFILASVNGVSQTADGIYGDITASVTNISKKSEDYYDFYVYLSNASATAKKPGAFVLCVGQLA